MHGDIRTFETVFLLLLGFVVVFGELARRLKVAYPIVLVLGGLLLSVFPDLPRVRLNPELFFLAVLPPLLFHAAWQTSLREFRILFQPRPIFGTATSIAPQYLIQRAVNWSADRVVPMQS